MTRQTGVTAADLRESLDADPIYQAMKSARDARFAEIAAQRQRELEPVLADLAALGLNLDWIGRVLDLDHFDDHVAAVLLDHLQRPYSSWLLEWIGRVFSLKSMRPFVWDKLVSLLTAHVLEPPAIMGVMSAISEIAQPRDLNTLIADEALGRPRIFLVANLMRSKKEEARNTLLRLRKDPDLAEEIEARLAQSRNTLRNSGS